VPDWAPEHEVDGALAARLVGSQFPALGGAPVCFVASGWDNTVYLVGDVLFRFPRRSMAVPLVERELAVLPLVASVVPLRVPVPTHVGEPDLGYPWPFWGAQLIPGDELATVPGVDRRRAAEAAGAFLRALHDLRVEVDLPVDPNLRAAPALRREKVLSWLGSLQHKGLWSPSAAVDELLDSPLGASDDTVLVHGDLHLRHLLVDACGAATGIIDWGDTCFADPSVDVSFAYAAFSRPDRDAFFAVYGHVDADREVRARGLAVSLCAALADWASSTGAPHVEEYLRGIERARS
jgi:aminoglycoside phosphotransferase (APT) family kinase protein